MNSEEYETITKEIVEEVVKVADQNPDVEARYGRQNKWRGESGYHHQIDVSVKSTDTLLLAECKHWATNVPVEKVLAFYGRVVDIQSTFDGTVLGVVVTKRGFQRGAIIMAKHLRLDMAIVTSPTEFALKYRDLFAISRSESLVVRESAKVEIADGD